MSTRPAPLAAALLVSVLLHAALIAAAQWRWGRGGPPVPAPRPALAAELKRAAPPPSLRLPEPVQPAAASRTPRKPVPSPAKQSQPSRSAAAPEEQVARRLLYPAEAVLQGLEGEALVLLFLDESGHAVAARLERSSGHGILDEAALHAARSVRSAPDATPREVLLPVRFRLR